jgi:hypothetical protein
MVRAFCILSVFFSGVAHALTIAEDFDRPDTPPGLFASNVTQVATTIGASWKSVTQANGIYTTQYKITNNALGFGVMATNAQKALLVNTAALTANSGASSFSLSATLKDTVSGSATMGIVFNYQDDGNYYVFRISPNAGVHVLCYSNFMQQSTPISTPSGSVTYVKGNAYIFTVHSDDPYTFNLSIVDAANGVSIYTNSLTLGYSVVKHQDGLGGIFSTANTATADNFCLETVAEPVAVVGRLDFDGFAIPLPRYMCQQISCIVPKLD